MHYSLEIVEFYCSCMQCSNIYLSYYLHPTFYYVFVTLFNFIFSVDYAFICNLDTQKKKQIATNINVVTHRCQHFDDHAIVIVLHLKCVVMRSSGD